MPIYEYRCANCGTPLEVMQKVSDPAPSECPNCHAHGSMERLMSRTSFQLKGGGWYADLYGSSKKTESSSGSSSTGEGSKTEVKSDSGKSESSSSSTAPSTASTSSTTSSGGSGGGSSSGSST